MARFDPIEGFVMLILATVLVYLMKAFGVLQPLLDLIFDTFGVSIAVPSMMSIITLFLIGLGMILAVQMIVGGKPSKQGMVWYLVLAAALVGAWMFLPDILPPDLAVLARAAQSAIGLG